MATRRIAIKAVEHGLSGILVKSGTVPETPTLLCIHGGGCDSRYFDLPGYSVLDLATQRGFNCLSLDRPGYGESAAPRSTAAIREAADRIAGALDSIARAHDLALDRLGVLGHSIGGAVALELTAKGSINPCATAVSGIGAVPSGAAMARWHGESGTESRRPPPEFLFGPKGSYHWRSPLALREAVAPWQEQDTDDVLTRWPERFPLVAAQIRVPIHWRFSENERIWTCDPPAIEDIAHAFRPGLLDIGWLPGGGHLYELHLGGREHVANQLDFLIAATSRPHSS